jgi:hypothetical protein
MRGVKAMKSDHFIVNSIRKKSMDSIYTVAKIDKCCVELEEELNQKIFQIMPRKDALATEEVWSELSARLCEIAYLKGMQDIVNLYRDLSGDLVQTLYEDVMGEMADDDL